METRTKAQWQWCQKPTDCGQWITPPACQGQIVLRSYARGDDGVIYRRLWDQNDGDRQYAKRLLADSEEFEPWNEEPE